MYVSINVENNYSTVILGKFEGTRVGIQWSTRSNITRSGPCMEILCWHQDASSYMEAHWKVDMDIRVSWPDIGNVYTTNECYVSQYSQRVFSWFTPTSTQSINQPPEKQ